jgi:3-deoxy-D-manno-octulosonic-acid transferase
LYRLLYSAFFYLLLPLILIRLWWRGFKAPAYRNRWRERFGYGLPKSQGPVIWIHSVSVGETLASIPLVRALQKRFSDSKILVTTMTPTGSERVKAAFSDTVIHCYLPYDLPLSVNRFLKHFNPKILIIMETELWPNIIAKCKSKSIPVVVANARLSEKSAHGYQRFKTLSSEMLRGINIACQTSADAQRFLALGATPAAVSVSGNIKYEMLIDEDLISQAEYLRNRIFPRNSLVWIAASTHQDEDEKVLQLHQQLIQQNPNVRLIIVPRHPERFEHVVKLCFQQGLKVNRRTQSLPESPEADIFVGDSMGELLLFYAMADVAFVGGSLVPTGGHNLLEPAAFGCPVVVGPHTFNFYQITNEMIEIGAAIQTDQDQMAMVILRWLEDSNLKIQAGNAGAEFVKKNRGTLANLLLIIETAVKNREQNIEQ